DGDGTPPQMEIDAQVGGAAPDRGLVLALPERLRERRAAVRRLRLLADEADRAAGVMVADAAGGRVTRHPAADNQVPVVSHCLPPRSQVASGLQLGTDDADGVS